MQKYDNLGEVFKKLRTNRHISLKQISNEEVSASQISRFERGEADISLSKFLVALDNMKVEIGEFMDAAKDYKSSEQIKLMKQLVPLEYERNIEGFRKLMAEEEEKFKKNPSVYHYHLNTILLQSFVCKCDETIPFPKEYMDELTDYLFTTEEWNYYELILIGNTYLFIDIPLLHKMGQEILKQKDAYWNIGSKRNVVMITLLNIWETCLHRDSLEVAKFYREKTKALLEDETDLYKLTIHLFLSGLEDYKEGRIELGKDEMNKAIKIFEWVGSENLANNYKKDYARFVK